MNCLKITIYEYLNNITLRGESDIVHALMKAVNTATIFTVN